jgi:hypothetical protein
MNSKLEGQPLHLIEVRLPLAEARVRRDERLPVIIIGIDPTSAR